MGSIGVILVYGCLFGIGNLVFGPYAWPDTQSSGTFPAVAASPFRASTIPKNRQVTSGN